MDIVLPNVVRPHCRNYNTIQYTTIQLLFVSYFFCFSPFIFASFLITYSLFLFLIFLPFPSSLPDLAPTISHSHSLSTGSFIVLFVVHPISGDPDSLFLISCWTPEILLKYGETLAFSYLPISIHLSLSLSLSLSLIHSLIVF